MFAFILADLYVDCGCVCECVCSILTEKKSDSFNNIIRSNQKQVEKMEANEGMSDLECAWNIL